LNREPIKLNNQDAPPLDDFVKGGCSFSDTPRPTPVDALPNSFRGKEQVCDVADCNPAELGCIKIVSILRQELS